MALQQMIRVFSVEQLPHLKFLTMPQVIELLCMYERHCFGGKVSTKTFYYGQNRKKEPDGQNDP